MRVKCPNSDIYLDLPNDRMDMKFTCPACKKVHRVTITITSPGEKAPVAKKAQPPAMPKKYATGAYAPVVDIPIDADFILFDGKAEERGIDLGHAAPVVDRKLSERKTEVMRDPPEKSRSGRAAGAPDDGTGAGESVPAERREKPETGETPEAGKSAALREWIAEGGSAGREPRPGAAPAPNPAAGAPGTGRPPPGGALFAEPSRSGRGKTESSRLMETRSREKTRRPGGRLTAPLLALLVLLGAAYLGWRQYEFKISTAALARHLDAAREQALRGDLPSAGAAAEAARVEQGRRRNLYTPENLWNRFAAAVGLPEWRWTDYSAADREIDRHLARQRLYGEYSRGFAGGSAGAAAALEEFAAAPQSAADPVLSRVLQERAVATVIDNLGLRDGEPLSPEEALAEGQEIAKRLRPILAAPASEAFERGLDENRDAQEERIRGEFVRELADIARLAGLSDAAALDRYAALRERGRDLHPQLYSPLFGGDGPDLLALAGEGDVERLEQVSRLSDFVDEARALARSILAADEPITDALEFLAEKAGGETSPNPALAREAARRVQAAGLDGDLLLSLREDLFFRLQSENRRGTISPRTMIAWSMMRPAFGDARVRVDPNSADFSSRSFSLDLVFHGVPLRVAMSEADYETAVRAFSHGYAINAGWSPLFYKPLSWIAEVARGLRAAGVDPTAYPEWKVVEGPGSLAAVTPRGAAASDSAYGSVSGESRRRLLFFEGRVYPVDDLPLPEDADAHGEAFRNAARRLHEGVMADESIPQRLRQALAPVLMGTYLPIDPRDYLDAEFCRRLVEADYLEAFVKPLAPARRAELAAYREALGKLEAGSDAFAARLADGKTLYATARLEEGRAPSSSGNDQDPDTGERLPEYEWRLAGDAATIFYSPLPARYVYAFTLAEHYPGTHRLRPAGTPELVEVWHATHGRMASFRNGMNKAEGNRNAWAQAIEADVGGQLPPVYGPAGWNFPLHVLVRNDQGDPILLATPGGVVRSPDFAGFDDLRERRRAEDEWLDHTARVLSTPGELGLIFHQFFRYCSDSPLPETPNLIGSHFGHLDTHQTAYESLERRWVGRLIGDCDDLAEFFQELTSRQGKLSHVMNLPAHAACGYVDKLADDQYRFVVLQTGNVLQFAGDTLNAAVESAYRSFDRSDGETHMTLDAVPIFLRFADEETRTPFILSSRIYADREYAEAMIRVQEYWHQCVFSAAIREMEKMVAADQEVGNVKELGSLYQRVSMHDESAALRARELALVKGDVQATLSTLLEIAQLHIEAKDKDKALAALAEMEGVFNDLIARQDAATFMRATSFRSYWAMHLAQLGEPARAWEVLKYDVEAAKGQRGYVNSDPLLRTLVVLYDKLALNQIGKGKGEFKVDDAAVMRNIGREIEAAAARALFKSDDYYNLTVMRYYLLGRYAVARDGRAAGLARLLEDGPYATEQQDHTRRTREIADEDWAWFRIAPALYLSYAQEMLNPDDDPELYDPETARQLLECVARAVQKGSGLGSDIAGSDDLPKSRLMLAFLNQDLGLYRSEMAAVKDKNYSSLYDDAALTFGTYSGLVPLDRFDPWIAAFREYFPGKQHYFKVVYQAIDKENYDHARMLAKAFAGFFPEEELLVREAAFVEDLLPRLKLRKEAREAAAGRRRDAKTPAAPAPVVRLIGRPVP
ncbi:MAG: hypothetical protein LBT97_01030 [Planctomycetota bacterium]|jgi:hypothetical protein|nr:hypothetical protein [Planctomycetota bacterium]